jgi:hypothetical protein
MSPSTKINSKKIQNSNKINISPSNVNNVSLFIYFIYQKKTIKNCSNLITLQILKYYRNLQSLYIAIITTQPIRKQFLILYHFEMF